MMRFGPGASTHSDPASGGNWLGFRLNFGFVGVGVHFAIEFVAGTAGALVAAAAFVETVVVATVMGVSKITVSARRLSRYATSCPASSEGTISQPRSGANSPL